MNGIAGIDVNAIQNSAAEMGNLLSTALTNQMSEVGALLSLQGQLSAGMETINSVSANLSGMGENINISA